MNQTKTTMKLAEYETEFIAVLYQFIFVVA